MSVSFDKNCDRILANHLPVSLLKCTHTCPFGFFLHLSENLQCYKKQKYLTEDLVELYPVREARFVGR